MWKVVCFACRFCIPATSQATDAEGSRHLHVSQLIPSLKTFRLFTVHHCSIARLSAWSCPPELELSESEFEQAGLLSGFDSCSAAPTSGHKRGRQRTIASAFQQKTCNHRLQDFFGLARTLQKPSEPWQTHPSSAGLQESTTIQHSALGEGDTLPTLKPENIAQRWTGVHEPTATQQEQMTEAPKQHRSMPLNVTVDSIRKQANHDHQKRFRERQKVLPHDKQCTCLYLGRTMLPVLTMQARSEAMQAQLDTTLTQMQELKLQKLELEQQLQRSAEARFVPVLTSQVQPALSFST